MTQPNLKPKTSDFSNSTYYGHLPPGYTARGKPEPNRYAKKCFSLILLTTWKQLFTGTHVHSVINQKSVIKSIKPQWKLSGTMHTEGTKMSANCPPDLTSVFIECLLCPWYCAWEYRANKTKILPLWNSHFCSLMNNPEAANERLVSGIWPTLVFCLVHPVFNFCFYNKSPTSSFSQTSNFCWIPE